MKYEEYIPVIGMAFMLLLVQLIAVALTPSMDENNFKAFEDPEDPTNVIVWVAIILIFTGFIFLVIKLNKKWMIQAFILISVGWTLYYIFYALFSVFLPPEINLPLTIILSVGLTLLLYKFPEWYIIDTTGVLLGAGSATIFGISLDIVPTLLLLVALLVYDYIAVYQTKHMVKLAEGVMDLRLPILLVIPKHWNYSFRSEKFDKEDREAFFMGLGDAVMPTLLVVSANFFIKDTTFYSIPIIGEMNLPAIGAILGTFLGFSVLMTLVMKGKPQAGLPFLNGGVILGFVVGSLIAGSSILGGYL
ncbi:MAG: presenilin family intramembrane aspartyl protease [Candidatus Methanoperedens sp.]|nr:presenilin family intramembrane aspartyl protease [Candidatus Methanoperedens sp.]